MEWLPVRCPPRCVRHRLLTPPPTRASSPCVPTTPHLPGVHNIDDLLTLARTEFTRDWTVAAGAEASHFRYRLPSELLGEGAALYSVESRHGPQQRAAALVEGWNAAVAEGSPLRQREGGDMAVGAGPGSTPQGAVPPHAQEQEGARPRPPGSGAATGTAPSAPEHRAAARERALRGYERNVISGRPGAPRPRPPDAARRLGPLVAAPVRSRGREPANVEVQGVGGTAEPLPTRLEGDGCADADLDTMSHSVGGCAMYTSRALAGSVDVVLCPYNYVVDPHVRRAVGSCCGADPCRWTCARRRLSP